MTNISINTNPIPKLKIDTVSLRRSVEKRENRNPFKWTINSLKDTGTTKKIILLVDDEPTTIQLINKCLADTEGDYEIISATDARRACELTESIMPDLIITEWRMSRINGVDMIKQLKSNPATRDIPVLVFSASKTTVKDIKTILSAGAVDCFSKSINERELSVRISVILRQNEAFKSLKNREEKLKLEMEKLVNSVAGLEEKVENNEREAGARLELLIHSMGVKDKLLEKIADLRPYLNAEGKTKLSYIAKQIKWELNEEKQFNLEKRFDESNYVLYNLLDQECGELTKNEKRLCAYFKSDHSASEIAKITHKSSNSINVAFARIRSKLGIPSNKELKDYLYNLLNGNAFMRITRSVG